jgi:HSP20 family molecular chaperone IbpA
MAFFPIYHYRRYENPLDRYFGDQLDFFDPWTDYDPSPPTTLIIVPNNLRWVNEPQQLTQSGGKINAQRSKAPNQEKFRVQLNVSGFNPETIKTRIEGRKIIIEAKQEDRQPDGDYNIRELRKSYDLPEHADAAHMASYITPNHMLVIEVPIKNPEMERRIEQAKADNQKLAQFGQHRDPLFDYHRFLSGSDFAPKIIEKDNNQKQLQMSIEMKNYKPDEIKVSVKNNELIVKGERQYKDENRSERIFFFKSTTLPPGTQTEQLQSYLNEDGHLRIEAPYIEPQPQTKSVEQNGQPQPMDTEQQKK